MTANQTNKETYNRIADIYVSKHFNHATLRPAMEKFVALLPARAKILDLGCGPGQAANYFSKLGLQVSGIDFSHEMIVRARRLTPEVEFIEADILEHKLPASTYHGIWCNAVLLHFTTAQVKKTLHNISQALMPNGALHVSFMQGEGNRIFQRIDRGVRDERIFYDRSEQEIATLLESNGFKIIGVHTDHTPHVTFLQFLARKDQHGTDT